MNMKRFKRILTVVLAAALVCLSAAATLFGDVGGGAWYFDEVTAMAESGLVKGYVDGTFGPEREVTRAEFTALAARCFARERSAGAGQYWCAGTLADARSLGWLPPAWEGLEFSAERFEVPITREEAVYLLARAKLGVPSGQADPKELRDYDAIDPALRDSVLAAYAAGLTTGLPDGRFGPKDHLTRAQAAVLLYRALPKEGATLKVVNAWDSGSGHFTQYDLTITSPAGSHGWSVGLVGDGQVEQSWNCRLRRESGRLVVEPETYNGDIPAGGSVTVGLIVKGGPLEPLPGALAASERETAADTAPTGSPLPEAPVSVPVGEAKPLHVEGTHLCDSDGNPVQLRGVSTHGLAWFPDYVSEDAFRTLRDGWGANVVRLALYTAEYGGYCNGGDREGLEDLIDKGVKAADKLGMYVIIDWHILFDGNPADHADEAVEFFARMSAKYASYENVLYEICNEPQNAPWNTVIKPYAETVISAIRQNDSDAIILVGTNTWSQDVDEVIGSRLEDENTVYTFHFYAATHKDSYRRKVTAALDAGVPVFVSECGFCDSSGNGSIDYDSAEAWLELLNSRGVSFVVWNLSNKAETAALIRPECQKVSDWTEDDLSESGKLVKMILQNP